MFFDGEYEVFEHSIKYVCRNSVGDMKINYSDFGIQFRLQNGLRIISKVSIKKLLYLSRIYFLLFLNINATT